ncbi:uncharacterized protein BX664DRAFT_303148 [Halteromyces radiatus]|uniref:uncharacterized protein n=1 Tax=Halteromyces radiatus TaxID=101107 RepID=UPI00221FA5D6|nr:uncharacterized protein BX664DRAFT_303148 [Halteromyces radiatus]KAI8079988.1 hypothetical protein BX664DRAFT_303148 [Halteromyces radiatus]
MKVILCLVSTFLFLAAVIAQTVHIRYPVAGTRIRIGRSFTAQIVKPNAVVGCTEVAIVLAIASCNNGVCPQPANHLGTVLYNGPFNPELHEIPGNPYQNFTMKVPQNLSPGPAIFTFTHLCLRGAGPSPLLEYGEQSITTIA